MSLWDRIDAESKPALNMLWEAIPRGLNSIPDIVARRAAYSAFRAAAPKADYPHLNVTDHTFKGPGDDLGLRLYRPLAAGNEAPGLIYIHGGGMIMGNLESQDSHNMGLMGVSAGGGLALAAALMLRDRQGPSLKYLLPLCPMIDDRHHTDSSKTVLDIGVWDREASIEAWNWYLGNSAPDAYAAPARAEDLSGLPPTYIDVGDLDLFRDEDMLIAQRLSAAGVPVEFHLWTGAYHVSELFAPQATLSKRIWATRYAAIRRFAGIDG